MKPIVGLLIIIGIMSLPTLLFGQDKADPAKPTTIVFDLGKKVKLEMVKINAKGKKFQMGSPPKEKENGLSEDQIEVAFNHNYYLGKYEVTQEQYFAIMGNNPSGFKGATNPVEQVTWDDAQAFMAKLNLKFKDRKLTFRLPTEAEWEYACRAGTTTKFHFGNVCNGNEANIGGRFAVGVSVKEEKTTVVGSYAANAFGLYDMHGNVAEWCADLYSSTKGRSEDGKGVKVEDYNRFRALRGGSYIESPVNCRSACNRIAFPTFNVRSNGFRIALSSSD